MDGTLSCLLLVPWSLDLISCWSVNKVWMQPYGGGSKTFDGVEIMVVRTQRRTDQKIFLVLDRQSCLDLARGVDNFKTKD